MARQCPLANDNLAAAATSTSTAVSSSSRCDSNVMKRKLSNAISDERADSEPTWRLMTSTLDCHMDVADVSFADSSVALPSLDDSSSCNSSCNVLVRQNACERSSPLREEVKLPSLSLELATDLDQVPKGLGSLSTSLSADSGHPLASLQRAGSFSLLSSRKLFTSNSGDSPCVIICFIIIFILKNSLFASQVDVTHSFVSEPVMAKQTPDLGGFLIFSLSYF